MCRAFGSRTDAIEPQRARPERLELRRGARIAAGEQRDVVAERDQFLGQPMNHAFGAAIQLRAE